MDSSVTINTKSPPLLPVQPAGYIKLEHVRITSHSYYCRCCFPQYISDFCSCMEQLFSYFYTKEFDGGSGGEEGLSQMFQEKSKSSEKNLPLKNLLNKKLNLPS